MPQLPTEDFGDLSKLPFGYDEYLEFLKLRRSVRIFIDKPVERELIEKILEAASTAPMGMPPHSTEVVVIDQREELDFLLGEIVKDYTRTVKAFSNPIGRAIIRLSAGAEDYGVLKDYIVDLARYANDLYHRDGTDRYMYHAPVVMLFHGNRWAMSYHRPDPADRGPLEGSPGALRHSEGQQGVYLADPRVSEVQIQKEHSPRSRRREVSLIILRRESWCP
jgi:hypothetical protein